MGITDKIKIRAGKKLIQSQIARSSGQRTAQVCSLDDAKSVGLLYKIVTPDDYEKVIKFSNYLKKEIGVNKVFFLGYWDDKKKEPDFLVSKIDFDFFTRKDLNWIGIPKQSNVRNFINEEFDILIDLTNYYNVPLRYVVLKSEAKLKVGRESKENLDYYDVMISDKGTDFEQYCNLIVRYLSMLKP